MQQLLYSDCKVLACDYISNIVVYKPGTVVEQLAVKQKRKKGVPKGEVAKIGCEFEQRKVLGLLKTLVSLASFAKPESRARSHAPIPIHSCGPASKTID